MWRIKKGGAIEVGLLDDGNNNQKIIDNKVRIQQLLEMLYAELVYDKKPEEKKNFLNINYLPFTKISTWNNSLKLVAMEDVSDIFLEKIEKILDEIFINKENKIVETFRTKNFIQRIGKKDMDYYNPPLVNRNGWDKTNDNNEAVDFIWEVDESDLQINVVFEHLLHTIYLALTFTDSSIWSFENDNSLVNKAMGEAISKGIYNINNYKFIKDEDINAYKRIIVQEYVFWLIYTMWGFNRIFKSWPSSLMQKLSKP